MSRLAHLILPRLSIVIVDAAAEQNAAESSDYVYFVCHPSDYKKIEMLSDTVELDCSKVKIVDDATEEACGNFRMDSSELTPSGGYYVMERPGGEKAAKSFKMSRSTGDFRLSIDYGYGSSHWVGTCSKRTEKFKF